MFSSLGSRCFHLSAKVKVICCPSVHSGWGSICANTGCEESKVSTTACFLDCSWLQARVNSSVNLSFHSFVKHPCISCSSWQFENTIQSLKAMIPIENTRQLLMPEPMLPFLHSPSLSPRGLTSLLVNSWAVSRPVPTVPLGFRVQFKWLLV